ncbi:MAG: DUF945 family protein [Marinagarivorans sp.]
MKKWLLACAGLLVSLLLVLPLAMGIALEQAAKILVQGLADTPAVGLGASHFERGYSSSQLSLELNPLLDGAHQKLNLQVHFRQGPLLIGSNSAFGLMGVTLDLKAAPSAQLQSSTEESLYHLDGTLDLKGEGRFTDRYTPLSLNLSTGRGQWSRGEGAGRVNWQAKRLDYEGRLSQLSWQSANFSLNLADTQIAKQVTLQPEGLSWFTRVAFKALNAQVQEDQYWLQRGALGISGQLSGGTPKAERAWHASLVAEEFKSKTLQLASLDANLALDQVPAEGLIPLAALVVSPEPPEVFAEQAYEVAQQYLKPAAGFVIERLGAVQEDKPFWLSGRVELAPLADLPKDAWRTPAQVLSQLTGTAEIHLDKTLLPLWAKGYIEAANTGQPSLSSAQLEVLAKAFVGQGMLTDAGVQYSCNLRFKAGELSLNDKPLVLPF